MNKTLAHILTHNRFTPATWRRISLMLVLAVCYGMAETLLLLAVIFQVAAVFVSGSPNPYARSFGAQLSRYIYQLFLYLTYNSERCPFPFAAWPIGPASSLNE